MQNGPAVQWVGKERFVESPLGPICRARFNRSSNVRRDNGAFSGGAGSVTATDVVHIPREAKTRVTGGGSFWRTSGGAAAVWVKLEIVYKLRGDLGRASR